MGEDGSAPRPDMWTHIMKMAPCSFGIRKYFQISHRTRNLTYIIYDDISFVYGREFYGKIVGTFFFGNPGPSLVCQVLADQSLSDADPSLTSKTSWDISQKCQWDVLLAHDKKWTGQGLFSYLLWQYDQHSIGFTCLCFHYCVGRFPTSSLLSGNEISITDPSLSLLCYLPWESVVRMSTLLWVGPANANLSKSGLWRRETPTCPELDTESTGCLGTQSCWIWMNHVESE